jgi:SanA protein
MIDKLYKRIVRFFVETHIARIDFSSEEEAEEFYNWLYPDKSQKRELSMKKIIRICAWTMSVFAVVCLALMLICNQMVVNNAEGKVYSDIDRIKYNKVGLLLGTTPQARFDRITNYFFIYRIDAAEQLYKAGKIEKILISGDDDSLDGINETECMRDSLVARGVPANAIILDGNGYRTINSVINANKVYGLKSFTIISQKFHNERAIYQAEHLGLDVENIQAYNAKDPKSRRAYLTTIREYFARVKMFMDLITYDDKTERE